MIPSVFRVPVGIPFLLAPPLLLPQLFMSLVATQRTSTTITAVLDAPTAATEMTFKAGFLPDITFGNFQLDLLERLTAFALEMDNVDLTFELTDLQILYTSNLAIIGPECYEEELVIVNDTSYNCSDFDMIVGDFTPNAERYALVDFTPPWLQTSLSSLKYTADTSNPLKMDITTLSEAMRTGAGVCAYKDSYTPTVLERLFPGISLVPCDGEEETEGGCLNKLKTEQCALWVSDELVLRRIQADKPNFEMTGEQMERSWLAWPVRRSLDQDAAFLLNKWIYAALSNQTMSELYFEYFAKKLCPIGTAGKQCERFCDAAHGAADAAGLCVCESSRWTGADCSIEIPEDVNSIPTSLTAITYTMLASNIFVILVCGVWLFWQRKSVQVRVSQPYFLFLVLFGCLISSLTIATMAAQDDTNGDPAEACMAMPWFYSVGFSITFGTLFGKIRRVYKLFTAPASSSSSVTRGSFRRNALPPLDALLCIGGVLLVDVVILILWSWIDPLEWSREVIRADQFGYSLESVGYCTSEAPWIFPSIIAAFHFGLMTVACYMCYVARNIPSKFSEHKYVTIAMISNLQILVVGVPVLIIVNGDPAGRFFVSSVIVWMNDLAVVTLIFGNLMHSVHFTPKPGEIYSSEEGGESGRTTLDSKPPARNDDSILDADEDQTFSPTSCSNKEPHRNTVSSLSLTSRRLSVKSVSFNENVSISEIPSGAHDGKQNISSAKDRFASTKGECAPLKPNRISTGKGTSVISLDSTPNIPKRPAPGTSEIEDLVQNHSARTTPPSPSATTMPRRSSGNDFSPTLPRRAAAGASELEHIADDTLTIRPTSSRVWRRHSLDSLNASVSEPNEGDSKPSHQEGRTPRRSSVDSIPNMPERGISEFDISLDDVSYYEVSHQVKYEDIPRGLHQDIPRGMHQDRARGVCS